MTFFSHIIGFLTYFLSRSYAVWFFSIPVAIGMIYLILYILKGDRVK